MTLKTGLEPGSLIYVGQERTHPCTIDIWRFNHLEASHQENVTISELPEARKDGDVYWINVQGVHDAQIIQGIGHHFGIHNLLLEDIMNTTGRPKMELDETCTFICGKMLEPEASSGVKKRFPTPEHFSILLIQNVVVLFQETGADTFQNIRERIEHDRGRVRKKNSEYLVYLLLDNMIDNYMALGARLTEEVEILEKVVIQRPRRNFIELALSLKKRIREYKRNLDPLNEAVKRMQHELSQENSKYFRDLYDHILHETDNIHNLNEELDALMDIYHGNLSQKTNDTMRTLTVVSSIFAPLTFIVGVYGMNFDYMPELAWKNGYAYVWILMLLVAVGMLFFSIRKKWL
jgi:magnesium transporter